LDQPRSNAIRQASIPVQGIAGHMKPVTLRVGKVEMPEGENVGLRFLALSNMRPGYAC